MKLFSRQYFDFLWAMTEKEIKARYKRAVFGFLWIILNPLLQMLIIGVVFSYFIKIPNYFEYLFSGLLLWNFFSLSLSKATPSIVYERALLQKAKFPIEAIPVSIILANFINTLISVIIYIPFLLMGNLVSFPEILLIVPVLFWLLFFTIGISLLTTSLNVRYRDINFFVQTLLLIWFYAVPVIYDIASIPHNLKPLFQLNPLTSIFEFSHVFLVNTGEVPLDLFIPNLLVSVAIVLIGVGVYAKQHKYFVDWL